VVLPQIGRDVDLVDVRDLALRAGAELSVVVLAQGT
jgi:hypothetical protein